MPRIVPRDLEIAKFLGRVKIARPVDVSKRFGCSQSTAYYRLSALVDAGLAAASNLGHLDRRVYFATRSGLAAGQLDLPVASPTTYLIKHDLAATELVTELEVQDVPCITEREMRYLERHSEDGRYIFDVDDHTTGKRIRHMADVACELPEVDRFYVVEIELVPKTARRWRDILDGYKTRLDVAGFSGVLYLCHEEARSTNLARVANEVGLGNRIAVLTLEDDPMDGFKALVDATP